MEEQSVALFIGTTPDFLCSLIYTAAMAW